MTPALILTIAALLDFLIGDPRRLFHPVQAIGWGITQYTHWALKHFDSERSQFWAGVGLTVSAIGLSGLAGWEIVWLASSLHSIVEVAVAAVLLASCFAGRSLKDAAIDVLEPLESGDLETARTRLAQYVGRDTEKLSEAEILRAVLETVTENAIDGVLAPLFWAIVGAFTSIGSVPVALAYKAASTLDSMVGYREPPYTFLGRASARLEDGLTWIPCRLAVLSIALLSRRPLHVWQICLRDAPQDPSPNAGWSEAAYAAALGVQVGGKNTYRGILKLKPLLGDAIEPITPQTIHQATRLTRICFLLWLAIVLLFLYLRS
ncbi:cobalamin biosynthesis protein CobD [Microcoleus sp. FACHB-1515]|uniref:adenosylcobinamide-phosphate synthase CbiB n=1 Tax=Cyanophyceae TaxID=3028117 RepID=UPI0016886D3F|nr:adenosylcobinamide-phosphate synthase CbiB [Microcoleus sp. FACHB-1515]MBD2088645.1 cobalamin biosynthesis protein CobD [Microcoleus sp. FACHB-1515]